jgi:predicted nucleotide-binding protein
MLHAMAATEQPARDDTRTDRKEIFVVHGRDEGPKEAVAGFLRDLTGRRPVIFHEQVSGGATIIEKLERLANIAAYAVVIATGGDLGRLATATEDQPRARQNVIFELGYFEPSRVSYTLGVL